jgi:hypothetical protein
MAGKPGRSGGKRTPGPDARKAGRKAASIRVTLGQARMAELALLATAEQTTPDALAANWLSERITAETAKYDADRGVTEWTGEVV